jgi:hypothetical protein
MILSISRRNPPKERARKNKGRKKEKEIDISRKTQNIVSKLLK